jgi:hypothetical protein
MAGSAATAPASSIRRPTVRTVRWLRRHRPNRSADAGSCIRPAATAYVGRSRSARGLHCAAGARPCRRNRGIEKNATVNLVMNVLWAACCNHMRCFARFQSREPCARGYLRHTLPISGVLRWRCSKRPMDDTGQHGYLFDNASMTESSCRVETGAVAVAHLGAWGKEPN